MRIKIHLLSILLVAGCSVIVDPDPGRLGGDAGIADTSADTSTDTSTDSSTDAPSCTAASCDDDVECTIDECVVDLCLHTPDSGRCPAGSRCDPTMGCVDARCEEDRDCNDGNACNGTETCVANLCTPGEVVVCDDGIGCTADICDPDSGRCTPVFDDSACDDEIACTADRCTAEGCVYDANDDACDDGLCAVGGRCMVGVGCVGGMERSCDDSDTCTIDACDPSDGMCQNIQADRDGDGVVCSLDCDDDDDSLGEARDEVCNGIDDDCDGVIDNGVCSPDTCDSPRTLTLTGGGEVRFAADFGDFEDDYETACDGGGGGRDAVFAVDIPDGSALLIDATPVGMNADTVLAVSTECGDFEGFAGRGCNDDTRASRSRASRMWVHGYGGETIYILVDQYGPRSGTGFELQVRAFDDTDDSCSEEFDITGGGTVVGRAFGDRSSSRRASCGFMTGVGGGDATFQFDTEPGRARVTAWSDDYRPILHAAIECSTSTLGTVTCDAGSPAMIEFTIDDDRVSNYSIFVDGFTRDPNLAYTMTFEVR